MRIVFNLFLEKNRNPGNWLPASRSQISLKKAKKNCLKFQKSKEKFHFVILDSWRHENILQLYVTLRYKIHMARNSLHQEMHFFFRSAINIALRTVSLFIEDYSGETYVKTGTLLISTFFLSGTTGPKRVSTLGTRRRRPTRTATRPR